MISIGIGIEPRVHTSTVYSGYLTSCNVLVGKKEKNLLSSPAFFSPKSVTTRMPQAKKGRRRRMRWWLVVIKSYPCIQSISRLSSTRTSCTIQTQHTTPTHTPPGWGRLFFSIFLKFRNNVGQHVHACMPWPKANPMTAPLNRINFPDLVIHTLFNNNCNTRTRTFVIIP